MATGGPESSETISGAQTPEEITAQIERNAKELAGIAETLAGRAKARESLSKQYGSVDANHVLDTGLQKRRDFLQKEQKRLEAMRNKSAK